MGISRCGLPLLIHNLCCEWGGGTMIEAVLLEIIYLLLFVIIVETIIVICLNYTGYNFKQIDNKKTHLYLTVRCVFLHI